MSGYKIELARFISIAHVACGRVPAAYEADANDLSPTISRLALDLEELGSDTEDKVGPRVFRQRLEHFDALSHRL